MPKAVAAVSLAEWYAMRILFMQKVITEPMATMMTLGRPMA